MNIITVPLLVPDRVGSVEITMRRLGDRPGSLVDRKGNTITLANAHDLRFYLIKEGRQFVYAGSDEQGRREVYFGGMDESPFLVQLDLASIEGLIAGEEGFFAGLKPRNTRSWENVLMSTSKRQGDFFATGPKKRMGWAQFFKRHASRSEWKTKVVEGESLRGTRHKFTGFLATNGTNLIGEGTIEAPDHQPLVLHGPHLIEQAVHLMKPQEAD